MAQLDPSLILQARQPQIESPMNNLAKLMQVQGMQQQNQLGQLKMDEHRVAGERRNKLASLLQGQYETPEAMEDAVLRGGYLDEAQQLRKSRGDASKAKADIGKTGAETEKLQLENEIKKISTVGQILGGVRDQATYDQARATAQQMGLNVSAMPPQYDPAMVEQKRAQSLSHADQLAQVWKQKGYDLDVRTQGERERANRADETVARGQLGVSQGNLGLRRQELELNKSAPRGQFLETQDGFVLADPRSGSISPVVGKDGQQVRGKTGDKPLTEGQAKAVAFASRMENSEKVIGGLAKQGVNNSVPGSRAPFVGDVISAMQPGERQQLDQAKRDFINAVLRRESGAVISDAEFANAERQYFPQIGEGEKQREQKARNRRVSIDGMRADVPQASQGRVDEISGVSGVPKKGEVVDGYRFKGGNPADQKSWEKQ